MDNIAARLRAERERLALNQTDFAAIGSASKPTQVRYESGERSPDASYLAAISAAGADVLFILTGRREPGFANVSAARDVFEAIARAAPPQLIPFPEKELPRLESAILAVEEASSDRERPLSAEQKAAMIVAAFDVLADGTEAARARVIRLVRAT